MVETVVNVERTTTTTTGPPGGNPSAGDNGFWGSIRLNLGYYTTVPGLLKIVQLILGIICMACASPALVPATGFFLFVVVFSFIITFLLMAAYFLGIREALNVAVNWIFCEMLITALLTLLYFIGFIVQLAKWADFDYDGRGANTAAGVIGLFNFLAYTAGTFFLFMAHRSGATH